MSLIPHSDAYLAHLYDRTAQQGRLELTDRDRLDLLHRMSTNDLNSLQPGQGCSTVLTTALARIIDRVIVYHRGETALMLTSLKDTVRGWLQRHIFWQDRVKIRDVSGELGQLELYGPTAAAIAARQTPGAEGLRLHHFIEQGDLLVARAFPMRGDGFVFVAPLVALDDLKGRLMADPRVVLGDDAGYEVMRVEAGLPASGHELTEEYIPLEAALWDSVSFSKGCYIGQEIIARMESRNKLAKTLVQVRLSRFVDVGAALYTADGVVGVLTSVVQAESESVCIGLGFVKPDYAAPGTLLTAGEAGITAEVVTAPLIHTRQVND